MLKVSSRGNLKYSKVGAFIMKNTKQPLCTSQLLLPKIKQSICQEIISFMHKRIKWTNSIQCKFIVDFVVIFIWFNTSVPDS